MSWEGYVPECVMQKYGHVVHMKSAVKCYGMLRKHEGPDQALLMLFGCIEDSQLFQQNLKIQLEATNSYIKELEVKLADLLKDRTS